MVRGTSYQKYESLQNNLLTMNTSVARSKKRKFSGRLSHTNLVNSNKIVFQRSDVISNNMSIVHSSPVKSKSKRKFKGKLLHTSPVPSNKITKYYDIKESGFKLQENVPVLKSILNDSTETKKDFSIEENQNCKMQETIMRFDDNSIKENFENSEQKINKTESCVLFSPSTALSQLNLNTPKKISKIRKRLIPEDRILKNNSIQINSKSSNDNYNLVNSQTKLTEFYPVRRSVRKTEKRVLEEKRRTLEEAILSNKEDGLEVRIFEGKGRGIIAVRKFYKGEFVVEYAGELITMEEAQKRESLYARDENIGCYMYYFKHRNQQHCIDATAETDRLGRLLNHSRNGNLSTKTVEVRGIPRLILIAKEDIQIGSELTYDYGDRSKLSLQYHPWLAQ